MSKEQLSPGHVFASDEAVMRHALALAARGHGHVEPNPMVGAVVVDDDRTLIADGYHAVYGGPHAEAAALATAGEAARNQTLFVTLEPCAHTGKQPPCADAVVASGVKRVVCAMGDPFPEVAGKGFAKVRAAGIDVEVGLLEADARRLNAPFLKRIATGRPYVIAKYAMTLDGKMAALSGHSMWISGEASRRIVHQIRGRVDAIIVGSGTLVADDPQLTARPPGPRTPLRVVLDTQATKLTADRSLFQTADDVPVRLYHGDAADSEVVAALTDAGVTTVVVPVDAGGVAVDAVLADLAAIGATNVLLEGGAATLAHFHAADAVDEYRIFVAPKLIGDGLSPLSGAGGRAEIPETPTLEFVETVAVDGDVMLAAIRPRDWR